MKITIFGATGALGRECLDQCLEARHEVTVLARTPSKLAPELRDRIRLVHGDALDPKHVASALAGGTEGILFAIGVDKSSPENLCTDVTRHILAAMPRLGVRRLVWCGGGSTIVEDDAVSMGARFVEIFARTFMALRHRDKLHQLELLHHSLDVEWVGIRPLQMRKGPRRADYRLGFHPYSGLSKIHFADCADAMIRMLTDDTWLHKAPIVLY
ncbi:MAG: NAD-dependent epimerase/dehydratase family protein [Myxococcales bacterium]|nr:MAG: NAD-dependent epimerase/dehydratase family protein [Myxococcales bacterium]